jgi:hypothetical protein
VFSTGNNHYGIIKHRFICRCAAVITPLNSLGPGFESLHAYCVISLNFSVNFGVN